MRSNLAATKTAECKGAFSRAAVIYLVKNR